VVSIADFGLTKAAGYTRAHAAQAIRELVVNFLLPFLIFSRVSGPLGAALALMAAAPPRNRQSRALERRPNCCPNLRLAGC
jgi:phosphotransferase system  glucose/maltose/N-acetylglucosamine-specific IIC component